MNPTNLADNNENRDADLDNSQNNGENPRKEQKENPRNALVNEFQDRLDRERMSEAGAEPIEDTEDDEDEPQHVVHSVKKKTVIADGPGTVAEAGSLKDFIVMDGETPLFRTKVNGVEKLLPLDRVQQQVQKHEAADIRLQQASQADKQIKVREEEVRRKEAALTERATQGSPPTLDATDQAAIAKDAARLSEVLLSGTKDEIVSTLTDVLSKNRQAPRAPVIDQKQLVSEVKTAVKQELSEEDKAEDMRTGYAKFKELHPEILADANLFAYTDKISEKIAAEHPEWMPSQVLLESGKQTTEWVQSLKGVKPAVNKSVPDMNDRREAKRKLRPMPEARTARVDNDANEQQERPSDVIAEIRKARGQY